MRFTIALQYDNLSISKTNKFRITYFLSISSALTHSVCQSYLTESEYSEYSGKLWLNIPDLQLYQSATSSVTHNQQLSLAKGNGYTNSKQLLGARKKDESCVEIHRTAVGMRLV